MTEVVVDTDVVSFLFKNHPIGRLYDPELAGRVSLISFLTVAEVERWALQYRWSAQRRHWLHLYLRRFTVVPSSPDLCRKWAEVRCAFSLCGYRASVPGMCQGPPDCGFLAGLAGCEISNLRERRGDSKYKFPSPHQPL
jgi:predicted nucleic acid-binding protein